MSFISVRDVTLPCRNRWVLPIGLRVRREYVTKVVFTFKKRSIDDSYDSKGINRDFRTHRDLQGLMTHE